MLSTTKKVVNLAEKGLNKSLDLITIFSDPSHPTTRRLSNLGKLSGVAVMFSGVAVSTINLKWGIVLIVAGTTTVISNSLFSSLGKKGE